MRNREEAIHYRKMIKARKRSSRIKGFVFLSLSFALLLYAVPCFATSVWDMDSGNRISNSLVFQDSVREGVVADEAEEAEAPAKVQIASIGETVGPGVMDDEEAVTAAKRRAEAVGIANAEIVSQQEAKSVQAYVAPEPDPVQDAFVMISFIMAAVFAFLGFWNIHKSRTMRGNLISHAYSSALRAA